jgi:hypothetical protein
MSDNDNDGQSLFSSLIGSAAAGITLAAAFIYGAGALTEALRLGFTHLPWGSVVSQLPNTLLITDGFGQVVLPAIIIAMLGTVLLNYLVHGGNRPSGQGSVIYWVRGRLQNYLLTGPSVRHFISWLSIAVILGSIEGAIALPFYVYHEHRYGIQGILVPSWQAFLVIALLSAAAIGIALIFMPPPIKKNVFSDAEIDSCLKTPMHRVIINKLSEKFRARRRAHGRGRQDQNPAQADSASPETPPSPETPGEQKFHRQPWEKQPGWVWRAVVAAIVTFAVIPCLAGISASTLFPYTLVCLPGPSGGSFTGNLLAVNNGWAYLIEYNKSTTDKHGNILYNGDFFRLVPLSSVAEFDVGPRGGCFK